MSMLERVQGARHERAARTLLPLPCMESVARVAPDSWANRAMQAFGGTLRWYHRHQVEGVEHVIGALEAGERVLLVGNHCLDLVDPLMLTVALYAATGRIVRFIVHDNIFFKTPGLRSLAPTWGLIPNRRPELADAALRDEGLLMLYPGSGTEAILRSYRREPYRLKWDRKLGFVELAARHRATLLFVAAIGIDELYYQTDIAMPASMIRLGNAGDADYYEGARVQIGAAGIHLLPGIWPLPVRVTHVISPPLALPRALDPDDRAAVARAQVRLWAESQAFLDATLAARPSDPLDRTCRGAMRWLERLGL
jgi:1-acyl-sn-glycerol-3-phosphate acyltransferase